VPGVHGITSPKKKKRTKSAMSKEETERVFGEATDKWVQSFSQLSHWSNWTLVLVWLEDKYVCWRRTRCRRP
jgi:hypothetical protein